MDGNRVATFEEYTFLNRWSLTFLGIWKHSRMEGLLHQFHVAMLFFLLLFLLIPQWMDIYMLWGNINANAETFVTNSFTVMASFKLCCFLKVRDVFEEVVNILKKNWSTTMKEEGTKEGEMRKEILLDMAGTARDYTMRYSILVYSSAMVYFVSPFTGMQQDDLRIRKYPFFGWYYFDRFSDFYYVLVYITQIMNGILVATGNYATDSMFLVATYHTCAQLKLLQLDLKNFGRTNDHSSDELAALVRKHQRIIRNLRQLEVVFNRASLMQLLVSCLIICVTGFRLIIALNDGGLELFIYVVFLFVSLLQIFLYCRLGDELMTQSVAVSDAAYQSLWSSLDQGSIRKVIMIILRAQLPLQMTAGKIYVLSMPNFTMILKTSFSFLSLLRAVYSNNDDIK